MKLGDIETFAGYNITCFNIIKKKKKSKLGTTCPKQKSGMDL
jgi:hypothetical protein